MKRNVRIREMVDGCFANKIVLVTGASRGIGREIAKQMADSGAIVIANYCCNEKAARTLCKNNIEIFKADVSNELEVKRMISSIKTRYGRIDVLINNAGVIYRSENWYSMSIEQWKRTIDVNATGMWIITKEVYPLMSSVGGAIINVSSIYGMSGIASELAYSCSKSMVICMTQALAKELAPNIRVNAVCPGNTVTDMIPSKKIKIEIEKKTPLQRSALAKEIAKAVLMLAADDSSYITGAILPVDGGYNLK